MLAISFIDNIFILEFNLKFSFIRNILQSDKCINKNMSTKNSYK